MSSFKTGDLVRVREQTSRFRGHVGKVVRTQSRGLAVIYEVVFEQTQPVLMPQENKFLEYELEPVEA
ncbi:MAG: hypothetical protein DRI39_02320 [Chloroflexi bacterium]|nr:MAG: hypothetical protein DRI39_02320 [Chloroflexota bacterium]RLC95173.1 MAG: hypothetical protein DRI40_06425 [Chloroflexota bacterium]